jgi:hypothetical protein
MNQIILKTFDNSIDAHILMARLEDEGIDCFLVDENIVSIYPLLNFTVGGIKLKILENDLERAIEILKEIEQTPFKDSNDALIKCPKCDSTNLVSGFKSIKNIKGLLAIIFSFLFSVFPLYYKEVFRCNDCDNEFSKKSNIH